MPDALRLLVRQLQGAYSGELAAGFAYRGHWHSVSDPGERARIKQIEEEEWHHRELVAGMLRDLGAGPNRVREAIFYCIGKVIGFLCHVTGWFAPMYGAARLEKNNIVEYAVAAGYAEECGHEEMIECLMMMAAVEWEHEKYFRERMLGHPLLRLFPVWEAPTIPQSPARERHARASAAR
jgi:demethoxyubiquinone hydroxylase (CLK1/Coq7/Cat5 family)